VTGINVMSENLIDNHHHYHHARVSRAMYSAWDNYPSDEHDDDDDDDDDRDFVMFTFDIIEITLKANVISSSLLT